MNKLLKFADDTKIYGAVGTAADILDLQQDLSKLCQWSKDWLMLFNTDKCKVMHLGYNNRQIAYFMSDDVLNSVTEEVDLGVTIQDSLKFDKHCAKIVTKSNRILGMIKRSFSTKTKEFILNLYKTLIRPRLEYAVQAWSPHLYKDINSVIFVNENKNENCQKRENNEFVNEN